MAFDQASLQRIRSMKSVRAARVSTLLNIPFTLLYAVLLLNLGVVVYAYFDHIGCDPLKVCVLMIMGDEVTYVSLRKVWILMIMGYEVTYVRLRKVWILMIMGYEVTYVSLRKVCIQVVMGGEVT